LRRLHSTFAPPTGAPNRYFASRSNVRRSPGRGDCWAAASASSNVAGRNSSTGELLAEHLIVDRGADVVVAEDRLGRQGEVEREAPNDDILALVSARSGAAVLDLDLDRLGQRDARRQTC